MSREITCYISSLDQAWQAELCRSLHQMVHQTVPEVAERLMYGKPHYLKNGKCVGNLGTAKGWVALTIFNATAIDAPEELFDGPPERKTIKIRQGQAVDYDLLTKLLQQAASTL